MKLYKLTDRDDYTRRGLPEETHWGEGVTVTARGEGREPCSKGVVHSYRTPLLAAMTNQAHANINDPILWEAEGDVLDTDGLKCWGKSLTTLRQIPIPEPTVEQRVRFAIACALAVCHDALFAMWAMAWLDGTGQTSIAAVYAARRGWGERAKAKDKARMRPEVWVTALEAEAWAWAAEAAISATARTGSVELCAAQAAAAAWAAWAQAVPSEVRSDSPPDFSALAEWAASAAPAPEDWFAPKKETPHG